MYFGVHESECYRATHVDSGRPWLFPPRLAPAYAIWDVKINDEDWFRRKYVVDAISFHGKGDIISSSLLHELETYQLYLLL